jgi:hypothetical protein
MVAMSVRCGDCIYVTTRLCGGTYLFHESFSLPKIKPSQAWKCPYNVFFPSTHAQSKYRKYGKYWGLKKQQDQLTRNVTS